jgi:hypothetical protein
MLFFVGVQSLIYLLVVLGTSQSIEFLLIQEVVIALPLLLVRGELKLSILMLNGPSREF